MRWFSETCSHSLDYPHFEKPTISHKFTIIIVSNQVMFFEIQPFYKSRDFGNKVLHFFLKMKFETKTEVLEERSEDMIITFELFTHSELCVSW